MQCNAMQCNAMQCNAMQCNAMQCIEVSTEGPVDFAEVPFSEYQGGEFSSDDIEDTLFEWYVRTCDSIRFQHPPFPLFSIISLYFDYFGNAGE